MNARSPMNDPPRRERTCRSSRKVYFKYDRNFFEYIIQWNPHFHCIVLEGGIQEASDKAVYRQGTSRSQFRFEDSLLATLRVFGRQLRPDPRIEPEDASEPQPVYNQESGSPPFRASLYRRSSMHDTTGRLFTRRSIIKMETLRNTGTHPRLKRPLNTPPIPRRRRYRTSHHDGAGRS
jgi:hypothetical protein